MKLHNKTFDNKTYPLTYFDDISNGLNIKYNRFHILNLDKNKITVHLVKKKTNTNTDTENNIDTVIDPNTNKMTIKVNQS